MDPALAPGSTGKSAVFQDGLGERRRISDVSGADTIEQLCLRSELTAIPSFEFALRERASRLANFRHAYYARVRSVDRLNDPASTLAVVSDSIKGVRLANLLAASERRPATLDFSASLHLIRQIVSAVALLHENARDAAHGAIGPERIIVTGNARVVIAEYVLGAALEQLRYSRERYWKGLRVALPPSSMHFDHRADITQVGVVALSLVIGRVLHDDEYPAGAGDVLALASAITPKGEHGPLPDGIRTWIGRALQLDARHAFANAIEARDELDRVLEGDDADEEETTTAAAAVTMPPSPVAPIANAANVPSAAPVVSPTPTPTPAYVAPAASVLPPVSATTPAPMATPAAPAPTLTSPPSVSAASMPSTFDAPLPALGSGYGERHDLEDDDAEESDPLASGPKKPWTRIAAAVAALVAISAVGIPAARKFWGPSAAATATGTLSINSNPPGAEVIVDGQSSGTTPVTLTLKPGSHDVELRSDGEPRTIPVTITAGQQVSQYIELPKSPTAFGQLQIRTEPAGVQVTVDGIPRGKSPVLVESLAAGEHTVVVDNEGTSVRHAVTVEAGVTASLVVPLAPTETAPVSGWFSIAAPVELEIYENKKLIGTTQSDRIMAAAGKHEIEIVNEALGYQAVRTIQVPPGRVTPIRIEWPKGSISINALPWAEVWIDGERVGETPIGNLQLPIGPHELVFRHPELGEQKYAATVSLRSAARVSVDLRKR